EPGHDLSSHHTPAIRPSTCRGVGPRAPRTTPSSIGAKRRQFRVRRSEYGKLVGALSELLALLASRATFSVRRAERRSAMATATKQSRAARQLARRALDARMPVSMEFLIFEDNGGDYHWTIVAGAG